MPLDVTIPAEAEMPADVAIVQKDPSPAVLALLKDKAGALPAGPVGPFSGDPEFERHSRGTDRRPNYKVYGNSSSTGLLRRQESQLRALTPVSTHNMSERLATSPSEIARACGSLSGNYGQQYAPSPSVANPRERYRFDSPSPVVSEKQVFSPACLPKMRALQPNGSLKKLLDRDRKPSSSNDGASHSADSSKAGGGTGRYAVLKPVSAALQKHPSSLPRSSMLRSPEQREVNQWRVQLKGILNPPPVPMRAPPDGLQGEHQVHDDFGCSSADSEPQLQQSPSSTPDGHLKLPVEPQQDDYHHVDMVSELLETANMKRRLVNEYAKKLQYRQLPQAPVRKIGVNLHRDVSLAGNRCLQLRKSATSLPRGPGMASAHVIRPLGVTKQLSASVTSSLPNSLTPPQLDKCWDAQPLGKTSYVSARADEAIKRLVGMSQ